MSHNNNPRQYNPNFVDQRNNRNKKRNKHKNNDGLPNNIYYNTNAPTYFPGAMTHLTNSNGTPSSTYYNTNAPTYTPGAMTHLTSTSDTFPGQHNFADHSEKNAEDIVLLIKDARASYTKYSINTKEVVYHSLATVCSRALTELENAAEEKRSTDVVVEELMGTLESIWVARKK